MTPDQIEKLKTFNDLIVIHPMYRDAIDTLHRAMEANKIKGHESCAVLLGDPGTGKTRICDQLIAEYPQPFYIHEPIGIRLIRPVISLVVPSDTTIKSLATRILRKLTEKEPSEHASLEVVEYRLFTLLENSRTELLILDEAQGILRSQTARTIETCANWLKILTDTFKKTVCIVGENDCEKLIQHEALSGRFPYVAILRNFDLNTPDAYDDFTRLIRAFAIEINKNMGFSAIPPLTEERYVLALYVKSKGNLRTLRNLFEAALTRAYSTNESTLLNEHFIFAADNIHTSKPLSHKNPFNISTESLRKIISSNTGKAS